MPENEVGAIFDETLSRDRHHRAKKWYPGKKLNLTRYLPNPGDKGSLRDLKIGDRTFQTLEKFQVSKSQNPDLQDLFLRNFFFMWYFRDFYLKGTSRD